MQIQRKSQDAPAIAHMDFNHRYADFKRYICGSYIICQQFKTDTGVINVFIGRLVF